MADLKSLYDNDTAAWAEQQAAALRAAARGNSNQLVDWENLAEEIESLGKSLKYALASQIFRVLHHLVDWPKQTAIQLGQRPEICNDPHNSGVKSVITSQPCASVWVMS